MLYANDYTYDIQYLNSLKIKKTSVRHFVFGGHFGCPFDFWNVYFSEFKLDLLRYKFRYQHSETWSGFHGLLPTVRMRRFLNFSLLKEILYFWWGIFSKINHFLPKKPNYEKSCFKTHIYWKQKWKWKICAYGLLIWTCWIQIWH